MLAVQRQVHAVAGSGTQRIGVDQRMGIAGADGVVDEGLGPARPPHAGRGHYGALDVGVAGNRQVLLGLCAVQRNLGRFGAELCHALQLLLQPEAGGDQDLVVAAAAGVDLAAGIAEAFGQARFDRRVTILVLGIEHEAAFAEVLRQDLQFAQQFCQFIGAEDADVLQALRMRGAGSDVMQEELAVEDHVVAGEEGLDLGVDGDAGLRQRRSAMGAPECVFSAGSTSVRRCQARG